MISAGGSSSRDAVRAPGPPTTLDAAFVHGWTGCARVAGATAIPPEGVAVLFDLERWRPWLTAAWRLLDAAEQSRALRKRRESDRDDTVLAYALHRLVLARMLRCAPASVRLRRDALGRPRVEGDCVATSLSHAGGAVAVAVAPGPVLGIDLEPAVRAVVMPELADRVWHPAEAADFAAGGGGDPALPLLRAWVCKEALLKAAGIGLAREMSDFAAGPAARVPLPLEHGGEGPETVRVHLLDVGPDWVAAVAGGSDAMPVVAWLHPPAA